MIVIVAGKTVKGPVTIDIANNEDAEPVPTVAQRPERMGF